MIYDKESDTPIHIALDKWFCIKFPHSRNSIISIVYGMTHHLTGFQKINSLQPNKYGVGRTHLHCDCRPPLINVRIRAALDDLSYVVHRTRPGLAKRECQSMRMPMALIKGRVYLLSNMNRARMWALQVCGVDILWLSNKHVCHTCNGSKLSEP